MASNHTPVYGLNQWSLDDGIIMAEFNEDNQKTEQALVATNATIAALQQETEILRADRAALEQAIAAAKAEAKAGDNTLQTAINAAKAEAKSGDNTLSAAINAAKSEAKNDDNALLQALNAAKATIPKIASGTYVGNGIGGEDNPTSLTFAFEPKLLIVTKDASKELASSWGGSAMYTFIALRGTPGFTYLSSLNNSSGVERTHLSWEGTTVRWWHKDSGNVNAYLQFNENNMIYYYFAIG